MSKSLKAVVLSVSIALVLFTLAGGLGVSASSDEGAYRQLAVYSEVLSRIRSEYVEEPNIPKVTDGALHGLLESLDANSSYLTPEEYKEYRSREKAGDAAIGATISKRFGYAAVVAVVPGSPAAKAGVEGSDIIEAIEGRSTRDMSLAEVNYLLAGQPGSTVNFTVVRARRNEPLKFAVQRDVVQAPPVNEKTLEDGIAYIKVDAFSKGKTQDLAARLKDIQNRGAKKLILDVRNCADGDPQEGVTAANLFLSHGMIAYIQGQKFPRQTFNADPTKQVTGLPLVVLVNRGTAGAAEIVAAAILENARGDVLGDKTFGVGSIQKVIEVPNGSALILSIAKYYTPKGKAIQDVAVTPNITVAENDEDIVLPDETEGGAEAETATPPAPDPKKALGNPNTDEQLRRAIDVLKNQGKRAA